MIAWGNTTDRIMNLLQDNELTKVEICSALGLGHDNVASVLTRLRTKSARYDKRIYICKYVRNAVGKRYCLRPVFAVGNKADAFKPAPLTNKERSAKNHRKKMMIKKNAKLHSWMSV